jgi:hypothetical protein
VFVCHHCGSIDFDKEAIPEDPDYLHTYLQNKAPPNINTLHTGRSSNTALNSIAQNTATKHHKSYHKIKSPIHTEKLHTFYYIYAINNQTTQKGN